MIMTMGMIMILIMVMIMNSSDAAFHRAASTVALWAMGCDAM